MKYPQDPVSNAPPRSIRADRRGQSVIEFAVAMPFMILITIGSFVVGMSMDRYITVEQLVRNAGNMFARGIDFSSPQNQQVLLRAASGLDITTTGGEGVVYLSLVLMAPPGSGANENQPVIAQRFVIGNTAKGASSVGTPPVDSDGTVPDYFNDPAAVATLPTAVTSALVPNQRVFVSEVRHDGNRFNFSPIISSGAMYSRALF